MTTISSIEWTEQTWNPTVGCTKISPGCKHCYAETMARRLKAMGTPGYENGFALTLLPERLNDPLKRKKPTVYFVNSMSDLFHDRVPDAYIEQVFAVIEQTPHHTYQILTKRAAPREGREGWCYDARQCASVRIRPRMEAKSETAHGQINA
jgi:protein gp37